MEKILEILKSQKQAEETIRLLIKVANNILDNPKNEKFRNLKKENQTVKSKILSVTGGVDCLKLLGFEDKGNCFILSNNLSVANVKNVRDALAKLQISKNITKNEQKSKVPDVQVLPKPTTSFSAVVEKDEDDLNIKQFKAPPITFIYTNQFLRSIETHFNNALAFDDKSTQQHAKNLIPLSTLEWKAQIRLRAIQEKMKKEKLNTPEYSIQDTLHMELLTWFKEEFFTWVDTPNCNYCNGETTSVGLSSNPNDFLYTQRIEVYDCKTCQKQTHFPRYNDLNILLETRRGRCGEWAQVFTLLCRTLGWDARYVVDELDHVWTEVYSVSQNRWVHCDPCENAYNTPLMYESGWNKKLSYIIAYSPEEVQDVTWRYSSDHKALLQRRKLCTEKELINALINLRTRRQKDFSITKRNYLTLRLVRELAELLIERKPTDSEYQGRISGSLAWRTDRGEAQNDLPMYVWQIEDSHIINNKITIRYSAAQNCYNYILGSGEIKKVTDWSNGVFKYENIFRKEEKEWKTVYLTRNEGANYGTITWKFELRGTEKAIDKITLEFVRRTFENGVVDIKLTSGDIIVTIPTDQTNLELTQFSGKKYVEITAILSGGKGNIAWQHAQIFRQPLPSDTFPFVLNLFFKHKDQEEISN